MGRRFLSLCGHLEAVEGFTFQFLGVPERCLGCEYSKVCFSRLKEGRLYRVVSVRGKRFPCRIHGEVILVELEEAPVDAAVPAKQAIEGAIITFRRDECSKLSCPGFTLCKPEGLKNGDKCRVLKVYGDKFPCKEGCAKVKVSLEPI